MMIDQSILLLKILRLFSLEHESYILAGYFQLHSNPKQPHPPCHISLELTTYSFSYI